MFLSFRLPTRWLRFSVNEFESSVKSLPSLYRDFVVVPRAVEARVFSSNVCVFDIFDVSVRQRAAGMVAESIDGEELVFVIEHCDETSAYGRVNACAILG